jgi:thioredoxin 1
MGKTVALLTASWCPRCPPARQLWERLRDRYNFDFRELDIDSPDGQGLAAHYGLLAVPAVIIDGRVLDLVLDEARALCALEASDDESQPTAFA